MGFLQNFKSALGLEIEAELDERIFKQRSHRIHLLKPKDLVCRLAIKDENYTVFVKDISESGIGFSGPVPPLEIGAKHGVFFVSGAESYGCEIEIVRRGPGVTGAKILAKLDDWRLFLNRHFALELSAGHLHLVDSSLLKPEEQGRAWWFFSPGGRELYFVIEEEMLVRYHLVFDGHYFDGDEKGFRYGRVRDDKKDEVGMKESHQVLFSKEKAPLESARRFLTNIERVPGSYLNQILASFR